MIALSDLSLDEASESPTEINNSDWMDQLARMTAAVKSPNSAARERPRSSAANPLKKSTTASRITSISRRDCPLTLRLHLSNDAFEIKCKLASVHQNFVQSAKASVDCHPPKHAMRYAKRMRSRKEAAPDIKLPLAYKNGHNALSLWTMRQQVDGDDRYVQNAQKRVDCDAPEKALRFASWRTQNRVNAKRELRLPRKSAAELLASTEVRKPTRAVSAHPHRGRVFASPNSEARMARPQTAPAQSRVRPQTAAAGRSPSRSAAPNEEIAAAGFDEEWNRDLYLKLLSGEAEHL